MSAGEARGVAPKVTSMRGFLDDIVTEWRASRLPDILDYDDRFGEDVTIVSDPALRQVIGNVIEGAPRWGMLIGWGPYLRDVNVTGNVIRNGTVGIAATVVEGARQASIRQNIFSGIKEEAIAGYRWIEKVTGDLAREGAGQFPHLDVAGNSVA